MVTFLVVSEVLLWGVVLFLGFLLLGTLQALTLLRWQVEQLEATTPCKIGRNGLKPGKMAPDFVLPSVTGAEVALHDFLGRKVLLVFTQSGCSPCHTIMPELLSLDGRELQVLVVNNGEVEETRKWAEEAHLRFPMLIQQHFSLSRRYEVFATPFAFLIDEKGVISSKGIVTNKQYVGFVLTGRGGGGKDDKAETTLSAARETSSQEANSDLVLTRGGPS